MNRTYYAKIEGIYCDHCRTTISSFIKKADSDASVKISGNVAKIKSSVLNESAIVQAVERAGYKTKEAWIFQNFNKWKLFQILEILSIAFVILAMRFLLKQFIGYDILNVIPVIDSKASLPALLIAGFLTSFHCIGMCGAINIAVSKSGRTSLLYNTCQSCNPSPKAFFVQQGRKLVCQNCGNQFTMNDVGKSSYGCNPAQIPFTQTDNELLVSTAVLEKVAPAFTRWQGRSN